MFLLLLFKFCNIITIFHHLLSLSKIIASIIFFSLLTPRFYLSVNFMRNIEISYLYLILVFRVFDYSWFLQFFQRNWLYILRISDYPIDYNYRLFNVYSATRLLRIYLCNAGICGEFINQYILFRSIIVSNWQYNFIVYSSISLLLVEWSFIWLPIIYELQIIAKWSKTIFLLCLETKFIANTYNNKLY